MTLIIDICGWFGALLILTAYALLSSGRLESRSASFQLMNIAGAAGFIVNSSWHGAWPSVTLNVIWLGIGLWALLRQRRNPEVH